MKLIVWQRISRLLYSNTNFYICLVKIELFWRRSQNLRNPCLFPQNVNMIHSIHFLSNQEFEREIPVSKKWRRFFYFSSEAWWYSAFFRWLSTVFREHRKKTWNELRKTIKKTKMIHQMFHFSQLKNCIFNE